MLFETERFVVTIGVYGTDPDPQYLVTNKDTGVVEFTNTSLYFVRDWANQMTDALKEQEKPKKEEPKQLAMVMELPNDRRN